MKLYLAPIMGVTDAIYRETFDRYFPGVDFAITPFICSVSARKLKPGYLKDIFVERNRRIETIPQILSNNADDFLFIAEKIGEHGYKHINWNLGCPSPMVVKKKRGSGLLPFPEQIAHILDIVCKQWPEKLSIKTRLGRFSADELFTLMEILNQYPLKEIIIHPRLGTQMYKGSVDLGSFEKCLPELTCPVTFNGDITTLNGFCDIQKRYPSISSWMIGRGLISNPFLASAVKGTSVPQLNSGSCRDILLKFHDELFCQYEELFYGPGHLLGRMKAIWTYWALIFVNWRKSLKKIHKSNTIEKYKYTISNLLEHEQLKEF